MLLSFVRVPLLRGWPYSYACSCYSRAVPRSSWSPRRRRRRRVRRGFLRSFNDSPAAYLAGIEIDAPPPRRVVVLLHVVSTSTKVRDEHTASRTAARLERGRKVIRRVGGSWGTRPLCQVLGVVREELAFIAYASIARSFMQRVIKPKRSCPDPGVSQLPPRLRADLPQNSVARHSFQLCRSLRTARRFYVLVYMLSSVYSSGW